MTQYAQVIYSGIETRMESLRQVVYYSGAIDHFSIDSQVAMVATR